MGCFSAHRAQSGSFMGGHVAWWWPYFRHWRHWSVDRAVKNSVTLQCSYRMAILDLFRPVKSSLDRRAIITLEVALLSWLSGQEM